MPTERFEAIFSAHAINVYRYVARRHSGSDREDITAEVFTIAWTKLASIPVDAELPWLYRTAWNVISNAQRKLVPFPTEDVDRESSLDFADSLIDNLSLRRAWAQLSIRDQEVLRLSAWEGLVGNDLALALGISTGGAGAALSRARAHLERAFSDEA